MSDYRRYFVAGGTYFFTLNAYGRRDIFGVPCGREYLRLAILETFRRWPFDLIATCLLPDHWHIVLALPPGDSCYAKRLQLIKSKFTDRWLADGMSEAVVTVSQKNRGERGIWQPRFWEHTVRDEGDLSRCVDYIHWNPRKHGLVEQIRDWQWSSFHRFVQSGEYGIDWGGKMPTTLNANQEWGEFR